MTYAEQSIARGRDDEHMTYEEFNFSRYKDGSVLDCAQMIAFTAEQVAVGAVAPSMLDNPCSERYRRAVVKDLVRNARQAMRQKGV